MCGRYTLRGIDRVRVGFDAIPTPSFDTILASPRFNVAPSQQVPVIRLDAAGRRSLGAARWGLIPHWSGPDAKTKPINARAETVATVPMFRQAFARRRCLMPADGFYEWRGAKPPKQPFFIRLKNDEPFAFAGIWERWKPAPDADPVDTCCQITTTPNELMESIHNRMPVILHEKDFARWLDKSEDDVADLLKPYESAAMEAWPVSTGVNKVGNDQPDLVDPV